MQSSHLRFLTGILSIALAAPAASAQEHTVRVQSGDWIVLVAPGAAEAFTRGPKGTSFGLFCMNECWFYFNARIECTQDRGQEGLAKAAGKSLHVNFECHAIGVEHALLTPADGPILELISGASAVTLATRASGSRDWRSVEFSMHGGAEAILHAVEAASMMWQEDQPPPTDVVATRPDRY